MPWGTVLSSTLGSALRQVTTGPSTEWAAWEGVWICAHLLVVPLFISFSPILLEEMYLFPKFFQWFLLPHYDRVGIGCGHCKWISPGDCEERNLLLTSTSLLAAGCIRSHASFPASHVALCCPAPNLLLLSCRLAE